ncbi:cytochrome P450 [Microbacterium sp. A94]|uniref:cytochrome P450 n=1 Tax=Microbacterium sp. A94 TaxID=3450717 RepID=UPI003F6DD49C
MLLDHNRLSNDLAPSAHFSALSRARSESGPADENPGFFGRLDGPKHVEVRKLIAADLGPSRLNRIREDIQDLVDDLLDDFAGRGGPIDFQTELAAVVSSRSISMLLGIGEEDRVDFARFVHAIDSDDTVENRLAAEAGLIEVLRGTIRAKRNGNDNDLLTRLTTKDDASSEPLGDAQLGILARLLFNAGHLTTTRALGMSLLMLLEHPEQYELLRNDPGLMPSAIEELFRWISPVQFGLPRTVRETHEIGGQTVLEGEVVVASLAPANFDRTVFENPEVFDVTRPRKDNPHVSFGYGPHQCIGQHLARLELTVTLETVLRRIPTLKTVEPLETSKFHFNNFIYGASRIMLSWDAIEPRHA